MKLPAPFAADLSPFSGDDLRGTLSVLARGFRKPKLWPAIIPATLAICIELVRRPAP